MSVVEYDEVTRAVQAVVNMTKLTQDDVITWRFDRISVVPKGATVPRGGTVKYHARNVYKASYKNGSYEIEGPAEDSYGWSLDKEPMYLLSVSENGSATYTFPDIVAIKGLFASVERQVNRPGQVATAESSIGSSKVPDRILSELIDE